MLYQSLLGFILVNVCFAANDWVDLVRVEDGKFSREIIYQLKLDEWQSPVSLTKNSRTDDFTPVSIRVKPNTALVLWKESTGVDASRLRFCLIEFQNDGKLKEIGDIASLKTTTMHQSSPTLIRDASGQIWGFWVGLNGKDDDIFYAQFTENRWSAERRLYDKDNAVPDLRPTARINTTGTLELRWRQFSFEKAGYVDVFSTFVQDAAESSGEWTVPMEYVLNPLEKKPTLPDGFSLPEGISQPDTIAINLSGQPDIAFHWNYLDADADKTPSEIKDSN